MLNLSLASLVAILLLLVYRLVIKPLSSPLRHLPAPSQGPAYKRLLVEPNVDQLAQWCHEIPNEGFIRYRGILNTEKVLVTDPSAVHDIFSIRPYSFIKPPPISKIIRSILGEGIIVVEGDAHKSQKKALQPAFKVRNIKDFYPVLKRKTEELVSTLSTALKYQGESVDSSAIDLGSRLNVRVHRTIQNIRRNVLLMTSLLSISK
jgi:cytochrome P450